MSRGGCNVHGSMAMNKNEEDLIAQYIELNPHKPWPSEAWLTKYGVSVWALIAYLRAVEGDVAQVAHDYEVSLEAVQAVLAYYRQHKAVIDARILLNEEAAE